MELSCLNGAQTPSRRLRPFLYVENNRPHLSADLNKFMMDMGYRLWWHVPPLYPTQITSKIIRRMSFREPYQSMFLPFQERKTEVKGGLSPVERPEEDWRSRFSNR